MRIALDPQRNRRGWAALLALVMLTIAVIAGLLAGSAPASLQSRADATQSKLDEVRQHKGVLTTTISHYTNRIDDLEGQVSTLRRREAEVQRRLDAVQHRLDRAVAELDREKDHLLVVRSHLKRALVGLRERLVEIYK